MFPTGEPDPATLINLGYYDPMQLLPRAQREYLSGGEKPGTFWRDLTTAANQVPRVAYLILGAAFVGLGIYTYREHRREKRT